MQAVSEDLARIDDTLAVDRKEAIVVLPILQSNESVWVFPDRPSNAQEGGFTVVEVHSDWVKLQKASTSQYVSIPRTAVERVERTGSNARSRIVLRGRLQWLTLSRIWEYFPEPPTDDFGVARQFDVGPTRNLDIDQLVNQAGCYGVQLAWANLDRAHAQNGHRGEVIYFNDGKYARSVQGQVLVRA